MRALFVGRFQPFHRGHQHAIRAAMRKYGYVVIGIGSSQVSHTKENPFSFQERKKMIEDALGPGNYEITDIPDFGDDRKWAEHILKNVDFDVVISGNDWVKRCFAGRKEVVDPDFLLPKRYKATYVREKMAAGKRWFDLVPRRVHEFITKRL